MTFETLRAFFGWCTLVNWAILVVWWLYMVLAGDWMKRMHGKWFKLSPEEFDAVYYKTLAYFKLATIVFNLTPYLVLRLFV